MSSSKLFEMTVITKTYLQRVAFTLRNEHCKQSNSQILETSYSIWMLKGTWLILQKHYVTAKFYNTPSEKHMQIHSKIEQFPSEDHMVYSSNLIGCSGSPFVNR